MADRERKKRLRLVTVVALASVPLIFGLADFPCSAQTVIVPFGSGGFKYTTSPPVGDYSDPAFDDSAWSPGSAPFGYPSGTNCFSFIGAATVWPEFQPIWIRKTISLTGSGTHQLQIRIRHDDGIMGTVPPGWLTQFYTRSFTTSFRQACGPVETYRVSGPSPTFTIALLGYWTTSPAGFLYFSNYVDVEVTDLGLVPPTLSIVSGNSQIAQAGHLLPSSLVVKTTDTSSNPVNGVSISFQVTAQPTGAQGASLSATSATTQNGTASTQLTLGDKPGQYQVTASCSACTPNSVVFTATALAPPSCTFSLSYPSRNFPKEGGPGAVDVTASDISCPVYSSSPVDWVLFSGPQPQYGSGTVYYSVASNSGAQRQTSVTVANQPLLITQDAGNACGDQRDQIIQEYKTYLPDFIPQCSDFTQGFGYLNTGDYSWALVRAPLVTGLGSITATYGAVTVNSAYRNPVRNRNTTGSAGHSRHMYGDAVDIANSPQTLTNWLALHQAAQLADANFIEGQTSIYPCRCTTDTCVCLHADWRSTPGPYEQ